MKDDKIVFFTAIAIFVLGLFIGLSITNTPQTTYNNTQAVIDCATTIERCNEGWSSTLKILRSCRDLLSEEN